MLVPTRGRPQSIDPVVDAFESKLSAIGSTLLFIIDEDDPSYDAYIVALQWPIRHFTNVRLIVQKPRRLGPTLNTWGPHFAREYSAVGFMGDDHRPRTPGFDRLLLDALDKTGGGVAYGNDLIHGAAIPTAAVISSDIVLALNRFVPFPGTHLWFDNAWKTLGERLGQLTYLDDVVIEHMHPIAGKSEWDPTYTAANAGDVDSSDHALYDDWVQHDLDEDIARIMAYRMGHA